MQVREIVHSNHRLRVREIGEAKLLTAAKSVRFLYETQTSDMA
jgi:hypothetical protein